MRLVIVGNAGGTNIGASFHKAACALGLDVELCDAREAFRAPTWVARFNWHLRGHRPTYLRAFSRAVVAACADSRPEWLLSTGLAPLQKQALQAIGLMGIKRLNYLTDDPWNPAFRSRWSLEALPFYDTIFSPRRANMADLERLGCRHIEYLPFGFDDALFYPEPPVTSAGTTDLASDVLFVGGADRDRVAYIAPLIDAGFQVALYGDYWSTFPATRVADRGHAGPQTLRQATGAAKVALCLVRRANRDGHVMRSFEIPAVGACMLAEDTPEHRAIFGADGQAVVYFRTIDEMVARLRWLLDHDDERQRLARAAHALVVGGRNTYQDRLITMLDLAGLNVGTLERSTFQRSNVLTQ